MFNIGGPEVLVIALIALVVVGPDQLPSVLRKAGAYASQLRSMSNGLRQEFMAGVDEMDPTKWDDDERGTGEPAKPIVPKGYAERVAAGEDGNPFAVKPVSDGMPVSQPMGEPTPEEAAAEATAAAEKAEADARRAMEKARIKRQEAKVKQAELAAAETDSGTDAGDAEPKRPKNQIAAANSRPAKPAAESNGSTDKAGGSAAAE